MRYCALIGSTKSCTPWFSMQKSPSSTISSKVNPYWKPEQPPPETNTRNLRSGFASSRISSPTLPAAASVKTSTLGGGGAKSAWFIVSDVALMLAFYLRARGDLALNDAVQNDIGRNNRAFHAAMLPHGQEGALIRVALDVAVDIAV